VVYLASPENFRDFWDTIDGTIDGTIDVVAVKASEEYLACVAVTEATLEVSTQDAPQRPKRRQGLPAAQAQNLMVWTKALYPAPICHLYDVTRLPYRPILPLFARMMSHTSIDRSSGLMHMFTDTRSWPCGASESKRSESLLPERCSADPVPQ